MTRDLGFLAGGALVGALAMYAVHRPVPQEPQVVEVLGPERIVTVTGPRVEVPVDVVRYVRTDAEPTPKGTECVVMRWRTQP